MDTSASVRVDIRVLVMCWCVYVRWRECMLSCFYDHVCVRVCVCVYVCVCICVVDMRVITGVRVCACVCVRVVLLVHVLL